MKKAVSLILAFAMLFAIVVQAGGVPTQRMQIKVIADKTVVQAGDTVDFTVVLGPVSNVGSIQMFMDIPAGLTYVEGSGSVADGARAAMGFDMLEWTDSSLMITGSASSANYQSDSDLVLGTFTCTVDDDASGTLSVGVNGLEIGDCQTFEVFSELFDVVTADLTVAGDTPVAEPTAAPATQPVFEPVTQPEPAQRMQVRVVADKAEAEPGDTVNFSVVLGPVSNVGSIQMFMDIPDGLTYVDGSGSIAAGVQSAMGFDMLEWTESAQDNTQIINGSASAANYQSDTDTVLATFACTVDSDASGTLSVGIKNLEIGNCLTFEVLTGLFDVVTADVTVDNAAPVEPATEPLPIIGPTMPPAPTERMQVRVVADKAEAEPGDTINYSVILGPVSGVGSIQMFMDIPAGLTYVEGSGHIADGVVSAMGFDFIDWTDRTMMINGSASNADYESDKDTLLGTFSCTVDNGASGTLSVGLKFVEIGSCVTFNSITDLFDLIPAAVTVIERPTEVPVEEPTETAPIIGPTMPPKPTQRMQIKVVADKSQAAPGDTVRFSVILGPVTNVGSIQMSMDIPNGLTYVEGSGRIADRVVSAMGFDMIEWTENSNTLIINGSASAANYQSDTDTTIATFACTVDSDASGTLTVGLNDLEIGDCETFVVFTELFNVITADVAVVSAPTQRPTTSPTEKPTGSSTRHRHRLTRVREVPATEDSEGIKAHYICSGEDGCGKIYQDFFGTIELTMEDLIIPRLVPATETPATEPIVNPTTAPVTQPVVVPTIATEPATEAVPIIGPTMPPTPAQHMQIKVVADKSEASPDDTVNFSIVLGPVSDIGSVQMFLLFPSGLTYVDGSGKIADGAKAAMGFDILEWTESSLMVNGSASNGDYASTGDLTIATFSCIVDDDASGTLTVGLNGVEIGSCVTFEILTELFDVIPADVTVIDVPTPRPTQTSTQRPTLAPPTQKPTQAPTQRPTSPPTQAATIRPTVPPTERPVTHRHRLTYVREVPATYESDGVKAHYICSGNNGCGKIFQDYFGTIELTEEDLIIPRLVRPTEAPVTEPVVEPTTAPVTEPATEPEPIIGPTMPPAAEPVVVPTTAPVTEPATEAEPIIGPTMPPATEPVVEPTAAPVTEPDPSKPMQIKVVADKSEAKSGDTVNFSVVLGPVTDVGSVQIFLDIPSGLTYIDGSGSIASGAKSAMGFDILDWTENTLMITGSASAANYQSDSDTVIAVFDCIVDDDASGTLSVSLKDLEIGNCLTFEIFTDLFDVIPADVTIIDEPTAAPEPETEPATEPEIHVHHLTFVEEIPATYESDGVKAHYFCDGDDGCGKIFEDAFGTIELTEADLIIPRLVRPTEAPVTEPVVEPTTAPVTEPVVAPTSAPITEPATEAEPIIGPTMPPATEPVVAPTSAPVTEPATEAEPIIGPTMPPATEPVVAPTSAPVTEPATEAEPIIGPTMPPATEPVVVPTSAPATEPATEAEPIIGPTMPPATEPVVEPTAAPVTEPDPAKTMLVKVVADKSEAKPGDTVNFSVVLGPVTDVGSVQIFLDIPSGLTYVDGTGSIASGAKSAMGFDILDWTESTLMITGSASAGDYASTSDLTIATFSCTVDDNASGTLTVGLSGLEMGSCVTFEIITELFEVIPADVTITDQPVTEPATEAEPIIGPTMPPATEPVVEPTTAPVTEPATEAEPIIGPTMPPATEPVVEPTIAPVTEPAPSKPMQIKVVADKNTAMPGNTVNFSVVLGPVSDIGSIQMSVVIPSGLTYVDGTGSIASGAKSAMGFDILDWTENTLMITGSASAGDYASTSDLTIATFSCTVDDNASGTLTVGLNGVEMGSCVTFEILTELFDVIPANVTITNQPVTEPATEAEPIIGPTMPPATEPVVEPTTAPVTEPATEAEPIIGPTMPPATEPVVEPTTTTEPVVEPTTIVVPTDSTEPVVEPTDSTEPVVEPTTEPTSEPATEPAEPTVAPTEPDHPHCTDKFFIRFDAVSAGWYCSRSVWCCIYEIGSGKQINACYYGMIPGFACGSIWTFNASCMGVKEGRQYAVIFKNGWSETYPLVMDSSCSGCTARCTGKWIENPYSFCKYSPEVRWDNSSLGPLLQITSYGKVIGETCPCNTTKYDMFVRFLTTVRRSGCVYGKKLNDVINSTARDLGLSDDDVKRAKIEAGFYSIFCKPYGFGNPYYWFYSSFNNKGCR